MSYDVINGRIPYLDNLVPMALSSYSPLPENSGNKVVSSASLPLIILSDLHKHTPPYHRLPKVDARKAKRKLIIKKN